MEQKITVQDLLTEMKAALSDEFVAEVTQEKEGLTMRFLNGQVFRVEVAERE